MVLKENGIRSGRTIGLVKDLTKSTLVGRGGGQETQGCAIGVKGPGVGCGKATGGNA